MSAPEASPEHAARLRVRAGEREFTLVPGQASAELEALLVEHDAETFVFLPLFEPEKKRKKKKAYEGTGRSPYAKKLERRRRKLKDGEWFEGAVEPAAEGAHAIPAAYTFDVRRYKARLLAEELGVKHFYWSSRGGTLEIHQAQPFHDDEAFELKDVRAVSREGRADLVRALRDCRRLRGSLEQVDGDARRLVSLAKVVVGFALAILVASLFGLLDIQSASGGVKFVRHALLVIVHPVILPSLVVGLYLRRQLAGDAGKLRRELNEQEVESRWRESAPHLVVLWGIVAAGVLVLTCARVIATGGESFVDLVDGFTTNCLIALWVLSPLTYASDKQSAIGSAVEAAITVVVVVIVLKITLFFSSLVMRILWAVVAALLPSFAVPEWIKIVLDGAADVAAGLFLFAILVGYTWAKTREHFGRWATVRVREAAG